MIHPQARNYSALTPYHVNQVVQCLHGNGITFKCYNGETIEVYDFDAAILVLSPFYTLEVFESACSWIVHLKTGQNITFTLDRSTDKTQILEYHNFRSLPDGTWRYWRGGFTEIEIVLDISAEQAEIQIAKFRACDRCQEN